LAATDIIILGYDVMLGKLLLTEDRNDVPQDDGNMKLSSGGGRLY